MECPICRDLFVNPRELSCSHIVCLPCLMDVKRVALKDGKQSVCPLCRTPLGAEPTELPVATSIPKPAPSSIAVPCTRHVDQYVFAFCDEHEILVCPVCVQTTHQGHTLLSFNEAGTKYAAFTVLYPTALKLRERIGLVDKASAELDALGAKLNAQLFSLTNDITTTFFEVIQQRPKDAAALEARRDALLSTVRTMLESNIKLNTLHIDGLRVAKDQLVTACRQVEAMVSRFEAPPLDGLRLHTIVAARLRQLDGQDPVLKPLVQGSVRFIFPSPVPEDVDIDQLGTIAFDETAP